MAPKRRGGHAAPKAKRGRAGNNQRLRVSEVDAGAGIEPPLAVANHPQRLVQFHRSEEGAVFVVLTTLWRWLSGDLKGSQGEVRLAMTLRRRGYQGAKFTAPTGGPGVVQHVELSFTGHRKVYPVANAEALRDFLQELDQDLLEANRDMINSVFLRMGSESGELETYYPRVALIENGSKLAVVKRRGCKPRLGLFALLKTFAPGHNPWYVFHRMGLKEFLAKCGVHEPPSNTSGCPPADDEVAVEGADGPRRIIFDLENISQYEKAAGAKSEGLTFGPCCDYDKSKPVLLCDLE